MAGVVLSPAELHQAPVQSWPRVCAALPWQCVLPWGLAHGKGCKSLFVAQGIDFICFG